MIVDAARSVRNLFVHGIGRVGGRFALEQMTDLRTIVIEIEQ